MKKLLSLCALFFSFGVQARDVTVSWTHPTQFTDGSPLAVGQIASTRVEYGSCSGSAFGTKAGEVVVNAPATSTVIAGLSPATYCFRAFTKTTAAAGGIESNASLVTVKDVPWPPPNPPVLTTVAVVAGMNMTPVYKVSKAGSVSTTVIGFADLGVACSGPALKTYRGSKYHEVSPDTVHWWGASTSRVAAACATG